MELETLFVADFLMFVGAGSASTGGGIKVTTLAVLALMVWAELRGEPNVSVFSRRVPAHAQRQAFTVATIALVAVVVSTLALMAHSEFTLSQTLFEALSAFGTVGLSTGVTADFGGFGQWIWSRSCTSGASGRIHSASLSSCASGGSFTGSPRSVPSLAKATREFVVIGLGRFGGRLAATLVGMGHEVLGVDSDARIVQDLSGVLTHVVEADSTSEEAMRQLGVTEFSTAVVAIGTDLKGEYPHDRHARRPRGRADRGEGGDRAARRLTRIGAHKVVFPERDMGIRVGHSLAGAILDYFELDPGFALVETTAPRSSSARRWPTPRCASATASPSSASSRRAARSRTRRPRRWCRRATCSSSLARSGAPRASASSPRLESFRASADPAALDSAPVGD